MNAADLLAQRCTPQTEALQADALAACLAAATRWREEDGRIVRQFQFKNYYRTLAFVNAVAWIAHGEDHHPEMTVTYNNCTVRYNTHSVNGGRGGLSINDFICAAKVDALFDAAAA
ncbi:MAG TPA: 4a-hydroxytetrahydrobiopterin dehydratase [Oxalicibacterium sp.]|jgi:4a-hydroxytetrahydrobiopterin dehydratase|nr:4a-hydroxytetrahydrobiopterin dehydratase [Oxalicibacterium sp.]